MEYKFIPAKFFSRGWKRQPVMVIVHWVAGSFNSCIDTFKNGTREASAHFVVSKHGEVVQMVSLEDRAWHAGKSSTKEFGNECNQYTIGIELEGPPSFVGMAGWDEEQIKSLVLLCEYIKKEISSVIYVTDHSTISPGRKIDVKGSTGNKKDIFPWEEFIKKITLKDYK